jgi:hypothetical protein
VKKWLSIVVFSLVIISLIAVTASCRVAPKDVSVNATDTSSLTPINNQASGTITVHSFSGEDVGKHVELNLYVVVEFYDLSGASIDTQTIPVTSVSGDNYQSMLEKPIQWQSSVLASNLRPVRYSVTWYASTQGS